RRVYERIWHAGNAWGAGLNGNPDSVYMTHPVAWAALNALTGAALDVPARTLHLSPRVAGEIAALRCPVFFPPFWGMLEHDPATGRTDLEIVRTFGDPISVERVVTRDTTGPERVIAVEPAAALVTGTRLRLVL